MKVIIVGGGLSGLTTSYLLSKKNIQVTILEASSRLGGRIQTIKGSLDTPMELGATWFSEMHQNLISLIDTLGLKNTTSFQKEPHYFKPSLLNRLKNSLYQKLKIHRIE